MEKLSRRKSIPIQLRQEQSSVYAIWNVSADTGGHENHDAVFMEFRHPAASDVRFVHRGDIRGDAHHSYPKRTGVESGAIHSGHLRCRTIRSHSARSLFDPRECQSAAITESCKPSGQPRLPHVLRHGWHAGVQRPVAEYELATRTQLELECELHLVALHRAGCDHVAESRPESRASALPKQWIAR